MRNQSYHNAPSREQVAAMYDEAQAPKSANIAHFSFAHVATLIVGVVYTAYVLGVR